MSSPSPGSNSEHRRHVFGFLDETGLLHSPATDQFFGLGLLIALHPSEIHRHIVTFRNRCRYYEEFKFTSVSQHNLAVYTGLIDLFFLCGEQRFHCAIYDRRKIDVPKQFKLGYDSAYNSFAARLVAGSLQPSEYIALLADDVSTKKEDNFERQVRIKVKASSRRNALFGICRLESHAVAEIQLFDVLLGTIAYGHKVRYGLLTGPPNPVKIKLVKHLQRRLNVPTVSEAIDRKMRRALRFTIEEL